MKCKSASDLVNTVLCTGMTTKEGVSVLERLLLTFIDCILFEGLRRACARPRTCRASR